MRLVSIKKEKKNKYDLNYQNNLFLKIGTRPIPTTTTTTTTTIILTTPNNNITTASTTTGLFTETTTPIPSTTVYGCIPRGNKCEVNGIANIGIASIGGSNVTINSCCNSPNNCNKASGSGGGGGGGGSGDSGLSGGAVAGIVVGSVAGVGILGGGAAFAWKKKGKKTGGIRTADE